MMTGLVRGPNRNRRGWILAGAAVYALLLMVNPVLHDDLAGHLKSPTQCKACAATPFASRVERTGPTLPVFADVGSVETSGRTIVLGAGTPTVPGRSPPA
jgi:hypothetical protein